MKEDDTRSRERDLRDEFADHFGKKFWPWNLLDKESDRGCAIYTAELLSEELRKLLCRYFITSDPGIVQSLFKGYGPLHTFTSRIDMAYVLGLIPPTLKRPLDSVRKVRNRFAHSCEWLEFDSNECRDLVDQVICFTEPHEALTGRRDQYIGVIALLIGVINRCEAEWELTGVHPYRRPPPEKDD